MPANTTTEMKEFADAAGLQETDMPSSHHPLFENDDDIRNLSDLIEARDDRTRDDIDARRLVNENDIDIEEALTFPHKKKEATSADLTPTLTDFDGDARTHTAADDEDDASYMTRADVESAMNEADPDPNAGAHEGDLLGADASRAPDITGTVTGIARGMATHLPQDLGAGGFQIEEPEQLGGGDARISDDEESLEDDADVLANTPGYGDNNEGEGGNPDDGDRIPTPPANPASHEDALDATRQMQ